MLTVDYGRLGVKPGERVLDLGAGGGRHAFEAMRQGAAVVAVDSDNAEMKDCAAVMAAMAASEAAMAETGGDGQVTVADARDLPFADATFDRVIAAEVLEHIHEDRAAMAELARVLRPGGTMAVTVPRWLPELVCWALSDDYHNVAGGHIRIYRQGALVARLEEAGLRPYFSHHAHALHTPYWWLKCLVGVHDDRHPLVRGYHRLLVWDIMAKNPLTRVPERLLNPVLGKSLVIYLKKVPAGGLVAVGRRREQLCATQHGPAATPAAATRSAANPAAANPAAANPAGAPGVGRAETPAGLR